MRSFGTYQNVGVPLLKYSLVQTVQEGPPHFMSFEGKLLGTNRCNPASMRGTKVSIFMERSGILTSVYQWQREQGVLPAAHLQTLESSPFSAPDGFEEGLYGEIEEWLEAQEGVAVVIERPFPFRDRACLLGRFLARRLGRSVPYLPVQGWHQWSPSQCQGGVLHVIQDYEGPPVFLKALRDAVESKTGPLLYVMPPGMWRKIRLWEPTLSAQVKSFPTPALDPKKIQDPQSSSILTQVSLEEAPHVRFRGYMQRHPNHHQTYQWLLHEGRGRLGSSSLEAWTEAVKVVPEFQHLNLHG